MANYLYKGVDLSKHNGVVDFKKLKAAGFDFVILRAGYGKLSSQKDSKFETFYKEAKAVGLYVGAYWYSYAYSSTEALLEAQACLSVISGKTFEFPIYYDIEEKGQFSKLSNNTLATMMNTFAGKIIESGRIPGLYTSYSQRNRFPKTNNYEKWLAKWANTMGDCTTDEWQLWQYAVVGHGSQSTISGSTPGCNSDVDYDYCYKDYPALTNSKKDNTPIINEEPLNTTPINNNETSIINSNNLTSIKAGDKLELNNTPIYYAAGAANSSGNRSGTFYIYSDSVTNGKIRITNNINNVGKTPAGSNVSGWIKLTDALNLISNTTSQIVETPKTSSTTENKYSAGRAIKLNNAKIYTSSSVARASGTKTGTFYIYSSTVTNNRIRITNKTSNVGKTPVASYVTGWINISDIK